MKYFLTIVSFFLFLTFSIAQNSTCDLIQEDLEEHSSANPPIDWIIDGGYINGGNANSGTAKAGMNSTGDKITLPAVICPGEVCFFWRASSANADFDLDVEWSQDNGMNWNIAHSILTDGNNDFTSYTEVCVDLPEELYTSPTTEVMTRLHLSRRSSRSFYFDDVCVSQGTCTEEPKLVFQNLPVICVQANSAFSLTVCADNGDGTIDNSFSEAITLSKNSGLGNLNGVTTRTAANGCAQFSGLSFDAADTYTLLATSTSLTGISDDIVIQNSCSTQETITVMSYNVLNFPNGSGNCGSNITVPTRWDTLQKIVEYVQPDVLMVVELQNETGADLILNNALNVNGITAYQRANFVASPSGGGLNNMFFYRSDKMTLFEQDEISTNLRDIGKYTVLMNDPNLSVHQDPTYIDFYVAHFKAGNNASDQDSRETTCTIFQNYINNQPAARNAIIGGDFNLYTSNEAAYQLLLGGNDPFFDPIDTPGDWTSNFSFRAIHTQSTRDANEPDALDCGARGGMDDRFDFILASGAVMNGTQRVQYIADTYDAVGNNGSVYNDAINDPTNSSIVPNKVLEALYHMSDHLPIVMDIEVTYPVPVVLALDAIHLMAKEEADGIELHWQSNFSNQNTPLILEKSIDGKTFELLAELDYSTSNFYDKNPYTGENYYRLKQLDLIGEIQYSNIVSIKYQDSKIALFPNPVQDKLFFSRVLFDDNRTLKVYNTMGQEVGQFSISKQQNSIAISHLPMGSYFIKIAGMDWVGRFLKL